MLVCGSQNAITTSKEANNVFVRIARTRLIILSWSAPELIDWKSIVLFDTKRIRSSSIDGNI